MINLITGTPGSGKTSYALQFLLDQLKGSKRKIYVHGIPDLKIPHEKVFCSSKTCDVCRDVDIENIHPSLLADQWHIHAPEGAVYFFDEAQNIYRPRSSTAKVPESVASFEVHRHRGLDFFLITQNPKLIDTNIRALVSRHIHLKPTWAGRFQYEWAECKDSIQSTNDAIKSKYTLDKKTFALYQSASVHTKQQRKIPTALYVFFACIILVGLLSSRVYSRVNSKSIPVSDSSISTKQSLNLSNNNNKSGGGTGDLSEDPPPDFSLSEPVFYTIDQLSRFSYSSIPDVDKLSPESCYVRNQESYTCFVPELLTSRFKNIYCTRGVCYAILYVLDSKFKDV